MILYTKLLYIDALYSVYMYIVKMLETTVIYAGLGGYSLVRLVIVVGIARLSLYNKVFYDVRNANNREDLSIETLIA